MMEVAMNINSKLKTVGWALLGFVVNAVGAQATDRFKKKLDKKLAAWEKKLTPKNEDEDEKQPNNSESSTDSTHKPNR